MKRAQHLQSSTSKMQDPRFDGDDDDDNDNNNNNA